MVILILESLVRTALLSSPVDVFLSVDDVEESVLVLVLVVHCHQGSIGLHYVFALSQEEETLVPPYFQILPDDADDLAHLEAGGHHEPIERVK
jgi:hypothetical protein